MNRTKVLLLVVGALAVAATVAWQRSFDAPVSVPPPAQLKVPPARATSQPVAPVLASNGAAAVAPAKESAAVTASPARQPAPRVVHRDPPPAVAVAPAPTTPAPSEPSVVHESPAKEIPAAPSDSADVFEAKAALSLRQRNFAQAREEFESALSHGGKATFAMIHDHTSGNFDKKDPKATCIGELTILANEVRFVAPEDSHRFSASWTDVRDAGGNKFFGSGVGAFHVTITTDGKYRNFNLAPESRDKAEGKLILDLLNAHARRAAPTR